MKADLTPPEELRAASGHSSPWCARHIGHVTARSWQYWESGGKNGRPCRVPDDVLCAMRRLATAVQQALKDINTDRQLPH